MLSRSTNETLVTRSIDAESLLFMQSEMEGTLGKVEVIRFLALLILQISKIMSLFD